MIQYKVKSVHQNVNEVHGFRKCQLLVFHEISEHNTLLQIKNIHFFLAHNIVQYLEKIDLLVSYFGNATIQQNI